jgi:hypothetical protein
MGESSNSKLTRRLIRPSSPLDAAALGISGEGSRQRRGPTHLHFEAPVGFATRGNWFWYAGLSQEFSPD